MAENTNGRLFLTDKDFVTVVDAEGEELPSVPKHWDEDLLPAGASKKSARSSSTTRSSSNTGGSNTPPVDPDAEPKGNASRDDWAAWATRVKGATEDDLKDEQGEPLGREAIRAKFGTPSS